MPEGYLDNGVSLILDSLAEGSTPEEILADYPTLSPEDIQAVIVYASDLAKEEDFIPLREFARP
ncbi:MAG TPA: DUF433 domain-containing protein [Candidatus Hypogeohydataceae bacterium YC41]